MSNPHKLIGFELPRSLVVVGLLLASSDPSFGVAGATLATKLVDVDRAVVRSFDDEAVTSGFRTLVAHAHPCAARQLSGCVIRAIFDTVPFAPVSEPSSVEQSSMTRALVTRRGSCAALAAIALSVAEAVGIPLEAWVRGDHVVVAAPRADGYFELLKNGAFHPWGPNGPKGWTRVKSADFPGYYLDNLAVRLADLHDDRAEATFERAIAETPKAARLRFNYGTFLLNQKRTAEAVGQLQRAVKLDEGNADAWTNLGAANAQAGDRDEARRCFEKALRIDPGNANAHRNLTALGADGAAGGSQR